MRFIIIFWKINGKKCFPKKLIRNALLLWTLYNHYSDKILPNILICYNTILLLVCFMIRFLFISFTWYSNVDTKTVNDHKPPTNHHKLSAIDHKLPAIDYKPPVNDYKPPANNHKRPNRPFLNSNYLIFLQIGSEAELDRYK